MRNGNERNEAMSGKKRVPLFECQECGKKFYSVKAAERASWNGCPKCNGMDIDIYVEGYDPKAWHPGRASS